MSLNNEIHDQQRRVPDVMPQELHRSEPRVATSHQSGALGVENETSSHSMGRMTGYRKRSGPEKPSESFSALDAVLSTSDSNIRPSRRQRSHGQDSHR
jgi:hypothetical protein